MIKVSVMYPYLSGSRFEMDYYLTKHIPLVKEALGERLKSVDVDRGLAGGGNVEPVYSVMAHLYFDSVESFKRSFGPHSEKIMAEIPNYTDLQPLIQISEVQL